MTEKTFLFKGLEIRSSHLEREGNTARDCANVHLDSTKNLVKRGGFASVGISLPVAATIIDLIEFEDKFLVLTSMESTGAGTNVNNLYLWDPEAPSLEIIPFNGYNSYLNFADYGHSNDGSIYIPGFVTSFIKDGNVYFMGAETGTPGLMYKYDGKVWMRAGTDSLSPFYINSEDFGTLSGGQWYTRNVRFSLDDNGNQVYGAWNVDLRNISGSNLTYNQSYYTDERLSPFFKVNAVVTITTVNPTILCSTTRVVAGQILYSISPAYQGIMRWEVESYVLNTSVTLKDPRTLTIDSTGTYWGVAAPFAVPLNSGGGMGGDLILSYFSRDYSVGYQFGSVGVAVGGGVTFSYDPLSPPTISSHSLLDPYIFSTYFEDFYSSEIKGNPPKGFQIREYGDACLLIGDNNMYFSDLSLNGTVENFTPFDNFVVGDSEYGNINSFFSNETFIAVFRERESYLISGNVFTGNFRIQSYRSTSIGGRSPHAIKDVGGQGLFLSNRGPEIAMENGSMSKMGDRIEPMFADDLFGIDLDLYRSDSTVDVDKEHILMFIQAADAADDVVMVFDYRSKEWFKWADVSARGGLHYRVFNKTIYYSDGVDVYQQTAENTGSVEAFWASNFETFGKASMRKRFQRLTLFLTSFISDTIAFKAYANWKTDTTYTDTSLTPSDSVPIDSRRNNPKTCFSNSFEISSTGTNKMDVDGFEYSFEFEQDGINDEVR